MAVWGGKIHITKEKVYIEFESQVIQLNGDMRTKLLKSIGLVF